MSTLIKIENLVKSYTLGTKSVEVLKGVSLEIQRGDLVSIVGKSGSGKSTLLNIIGILDNYDSGNYWFNNNLIKNINETEAAHYRNKFIGFVFQTFHLIGTKTALENVELPLYYRGDSKADMRQKAEEMLVKVGLGDRMHHLPNELSGGQKQRVAIARALVTQADLILADEPTGALDSKTSHEIIDLLLEINREGKTVLIVTHEHEVANICKRKIEIADGQIISNH
jgi:putative ABC transport system ATP-binding protein